MNCARCGEPIEARDREFPNSPAHWHEPMHRECAFRSVVGSLAHVLKRCSCFVAGSTLGDPEGMSRREAARAAMAAATMLAAPE